MSISCNNEGNEMSQYITDSRGYSSTRQTVRSLRTSELHSETENSKRRICDDVILKKFGYSVAKPTKPYTREHVPYYDGVNTCHAKLPEDDDPAIPDSAATFENSITGQWIHVELNLPQRELLQKVNVISRTIDGNGDVTVSCDPNLFLNTLTYDVEFSDGEIKQCLANVKDEKRHSQVDEDGWNNHILDSIVDYKKDSNAVYKTDARLCTKSGKQCLHHTTSSWSLLVL